MTPYVCSAFGLLRFSNDESVLAELENLHKRGGWGVYMHAGLENLSRCRGSICLVEHVEGR
jgi:hypothetical protein